MSIFRSTILIVALVAISQPILAWDAVEVVQADGRFSINYMNYASPIPGWCTWEHDATTGPFFHATEDDGTFIGGMCSTTSALMHCDSDSLAYRGTWPYVDDPYIYYAGIQAWISCTVTITAETLLSASRSVTGNLGRDTHSLTIDYPSGASVSLLLDGGLGPNQIQQVLQPGVYVVNIQIWVWQNSPHEVVIDPYEGHVLLKWEDPSPLAVESLSWSSLKATFR